MKIFLGETRNGFLLHYLIIMKEYPFVNGLSPISVQLMDLINSTSAIAFGSQIGFIPLNPGLGELGRYVTLESS